MTHDHQGKLSLRKYLDSLPRLMGTESSYCAYLKRVGGKTEKQRIIFPNGCSITCPCEDVIEVAKSYHLPSSNLEMTTMLLEQDFDDPIIFFRSRVIIVAVINGFGIVKVEPSDSRSFIGKVEISYRGHQGKNN